MLTVLLCALLLVFGMWNVRQYWLVERQYVRPVVAAQRVSTVAGQAKREAERESLRRRATDADASARVSQLYEEIDALTRMSEQLLLRDRGLHATVKTDNRVKATGARESGARIDSRRSR
jgi:hypothetical protein